MTRRVGSGIVGAMVALSLASLALVGMIDVGRSVSATRSGLEEHRLCGSVATSLVEGLLAERTEGLGPLSEEPIALDRLEGVGPGHPIAGLLAWMDGAKLSATVSRRSMSAGVEVLVVTVRASGGSPGGRGETAMGVLTDEP